VNKLPNELRAIVHLVSHDDELRTKALAHVNIERREINWNSIFNNSYGSGHAVAIQWGHSLWCDAAASNLLENSFAMDAGLRRAVLRALAIRWSIPIDNINALQHA
jgi:hypothetical protein